MLVPVKSDLVWQIEGPLAMLLMGKSNQDILCIMDFFILLTNKGSNREAYQDFQPSLTFSSGPVPTGGLDHRSRAHRVHAV